MHRLRAAALKSHVDLPQDPDVPHIATLKPLDLEPASPGIIQSQEPKKWRYVDPRKTPRYPDVLEATTRKGRSISPPQKQYKRISSWSPYVLAETPEEKSTLNPKCNMKRRRHSQHSKPCDDSHSHVPPLQFISFEQHEKLLAER